MHATLALGPLSLPTGPIFAMLAAVLALEVAGRAGRRFGLHADDVWNTGLMALVAGLIVARLWTIIQFWPVYLDEPLLIVSLRPSGFAFWPGVTAALVAAFAWMVRRALDPARVGAALAMGLVAGGVVINISNYLTGAVVGQPSSAPWAVRSFSEIVHPVGLYRALGLALVLLLLWASADAQRPVRTIWLAVLGYALVHLVADAWVRDAALLGAFHQSQVIALLVAVGAALALAREAASFSRRATPASDAPLSPDAARPYRRAPSTRRAPPTPHRVSPLLHGIRRKSPQRRARAAPAITLAIQRGATCVADRAAARSHHAGGGAGQPLLGACEHRPHGARCRRLHRHNA